MYNANYLEFKKSSELKSFIKRNERKIMEESILGFYAVEDLGGYSTQPVIFEFESYVVQVMFCYDSELQLNICTRESFYKGELTRHFYGTVQVNGKYQPFEQPSCANELNSKICKIEIDTEHSLMLRKNIHNKNILCADERFSKISLLFGDKRFVIYPQIRNSVNYMYYGFER